MRSAGDVCGRAGLITKSIVTDVVKSDARRRLAGRPPLEHSLALIITSIYMYCVVDRRRILALCRVES